MKVHEIMTKQVSYINVATSIAEAAAKMKELDIGALPVEEGDKFKGMLTDRDIAVRCVALGKDPKATQARDIMTPRISYVFDDDDVETAADKMSERQIRRLVVLNHNKKLAGFVSMGDLCRTSSDEHLAAHVAKCCSEPAEQHAKCRSAETKATQLKL
jgi:CBS domain-containing protein